MDTKEKELAIRARAHKNSRMGDLRDIFKRIESMKDEMRENAYQELNEYPLAFDYVTFRGQRRGYFRYQISWGGPSEEIRFYCDETLTPYLVEFWFLDWFCGKGLKLRGRDLEVALRLWQDFEECGSVKAVFEEGIKN